jgi:tetratricopeptide (TPR) repeat protein
MRRIVCFVLALFLVSGLAFADEKKAKEKIKKADAELQRRNLAGAEKNLLDAIKEDPNSIEAHDALGRLYTLTRRYSASAREFSTALTLDDQQHKLNESLRRQLIDDQGVAYALSGNLDRAKEIYLAALSKDPDYAMYNYNLACVYAELHDLDAALPYLKKSWEQRSTLPPAIKYPDPRADNSFKPYLNDPKFKEAVKHIVL